MTKRHLVVYMRIANIVPHLFPFVIHGQKKICFHLTRFRNAGNINVYFMGLCVHAGHVLLQSARDERKSNLIMYKKEQKNMSATL